MIDSLMNLLTEIPVVVSEIQVALIALAIISVYLVLAKGVFRLAEERRQALKTVASEIIADVDVSDDMKRIVQADLKTVFSARQAWLMVFLVPLATIRILSGRRTRLGGVKADSRPSLECFGSLWISCVLANSPLAFVLFWVFLGIAAAFIKSAGRIKRYFAFDAPEYTRRIC